MTFLLKNNNYGREENILSVLSVGCLCNYWDFFFLLNAFKLIHGKKKGKLLAQPAIGIFQANKIKQKKLANMF